MTKHGVAASAVAVASAEAASAADAVAGVPSGSSPGHSVLAVLASASARAAHSVLAGRAG
jgi:hypothetical protein